MRSKNGLQISIALLALFLVFLACGPGPQEVVIEPTPGSQQGGQEQVDSGGDTLTKAQKSQLAHATVRIMGMKDVGGQMQSFYNGSGTILTSYGIILTNCHVADPVYFGFPADYQPDALIVELVDTEDKPPVPMYYASVIAKDATLDLAVIRITSTLDGMQVDPGSLNLPTVAMGNSDNVSFGDPVFIFGFPGIGGDTITFSTGNVSGFDSEDLVGDRAWMKTDALIAGGNSGGLATNSSGEIIGIPSKLGTDSADNLTDCRVIQDTNGDGVIDQNDTCIPTGGFINGIRPVNWAQPMLQAIESGQAYVSPYDSQMIAQQENQAPNQGGAKQISFVGWSEQIDDNYCPINTAQSFQSGVQRINAVFSYSGMVDGETYGLRWLVDNQEVASSQDPWGFGPQGNCTAFYLFNEAEPIPDGQYQVEVYAGDGLPLLAQAVTSVGGAPQGNTDSGGVAIQGQVTDANTGGGIGGIMFIILNPGVDPDQWTQNITEDAIYTGAETDGQGYYQLQHQLSRGQKYGIVVGNKQLGYAPSTGFLDVANDAPNVVNLDVELSK